MGKDAETKNETDLFLCDFTMTKSEQESMINSFCASGTEFKKLLLKIVSGKDMVRKKKMKKTGAGYLSVKYSKTLCIY